MESPLLFRLFLRSDFPIDRQAESTGSLEAVYTLSSVSEQEKAYHRVLKEWSEKNAKDVRTWVTYNAEALPPSIVIRHLPKPPKEPKPKPKPNKQGKKQPKN